MTKGGGELWPNHDGVGTDDGHIVLAAGYAPYVGGAATWARFRDAAPQFAFVEVDPLDAADAANPAVALRDMLVRALHGARAIVAHGTAATAAVEAVAIVDPSIPVLLLSPHIVRRPSFALRAILAFARGIGGPMLTRFARKKLRRLVADKSYVREQLQLLVRDDAIGDDLLREACERIADPRTANAIARTPEMLRSVLTPIDAKADAIVVRREVLFGNGPVDRKAHQRSPGIVVDGARSASMLETPTAVAEHLCRLLNGSLV